MQNDELILNYLADLKEGQGRIEKKIDELDKDHDETKKSLTVLETNHRNQQERFDRFETKYNEDKDRIYLNMDSRANQAAREVFKDVKIWLMAGVFVWAGSFLAGVLLLFVKK